MTYDHTVQGTTTSGGVTARGLGKRYGDLWALRDFDLDVPQGTVLGLLGHNGAGKTTAVRILTTLATPTEGSASIHGLDVVREAQRVRGSIGLAGQAATVDGLLTCQANLELVARLYHFSRADSRLRAADMLERLGLADRRDSLAKTLSGGLRRRLDLAASLIAKPPVLFLDEPTTGLDPASRNQLWELLRELVNDGATLILTTQYLEEADRLADQIAVLDHGRTVATGTPQELKNQVGGERVTVTLTTAADLDRAASALTDFADGTPLREQDTARLTIPLRPNVRLIELVRALDAAGIDAVDLQRREASLDDVFLTLTAQESAR